jgi:hypothetical protein
MVFEIKLLILDLRSYINTFKQQNLYKPTSEWEGEMTDI